MYIMDKYIICISLYYRTMNEMHFKMIHNMPSTLLDSDTGNNFATQKLSFPAHDQQFLLKIFEIHATVGRHFQIL